MDPINLLKAFFHSEPAIQPNVTALRPGQIINGKVIKLFPNNYAEVMVGADKLLAKLEVQLSLNQQYRFQVQSVEGKIHLKMLKGNLWELSSPAHTEIPDPVMNQNSNLQNSIEQFVTQVPIKLGQQTAEATIQWNGRKKPDGKIDSNECRILFYLELANLGETLVDLQIQNRVLSISVMNGTTDIQQFAGPFIAPLKEKLKSLNYQLKTVTFEEPTKVPLKLRIKTGRRPAQPDQTYRGVDIRI